MAAAREGTVTITTAKLTIKVETTRSLISGATKRTTLAMATVEAITKVLHKEEAAAAPDTEEMVKWEINKGSHLEL